MFTIVLVTSDNCYSVWEHFELPFPTLMCLYFNIVFFTVLVIAYTCGEQWWVMVSSMWLSISTNKAFAVAHSPLFSNEGGAVTMHVIPLEICNRRFLPKRCLFTVPWVIIVNRLRISSHLFSLLESLLCQQVMHLNKKGLSTSSPFNDFTLDNSTYGASVPLHPLMSATAWGRVSPWDLWVVMANAGTNCYVNHDNNNWHFHAKISLGVLLVQDRDSAHIGDMQKSEQSNYTELTVAKEFGLQLPTAKALAELCEWQVSKGQYLSTTKGR